MPLPILACQPERRLLHHGSLARHAVHAAAEVATSAASAGNAKYNAAARISVRIRGLGNAVRTMT
jgi:hypothetical protein